MLNISKSFFIIRELNKNISNIVLPTIPGSNSNYDSISYQNYEVFEPGGKRARITKSFGLNF